MRAAERPPPPFLGSFLRSVDLSWCENLSTHSLGYLFDMRGCTNVRGLGPDHSAVPYAPTPFALTQQMQQAGAAEDAATFKLERAVLSCLEELDDATVAKLAKHTQLKELDLSRCLNVTTAALLRAHDDYISASGAGSASASASSSGSSIPRSVLPTLPWSALLRLNLSWTLTTNADVAALCRACPRLQHLNLEGCKHLNDQCVAALVDAADSMIHLSSLSFFFVDRVSLRAIVRLIRASRCYWLTVRSYYGDVSSRETLAQDEKDM